MKQGQEGGVEATENLIPGVVVLNGLVPCTGDEERAVTVGDSRSKESKDHGEEAMVGLVVLDGLGV